MAGRRISSGGGGGGGGGSRGTGVATGILRTHASSPGGYRIDSPTSTNTEANPFVLPSGEALFKLRDQEKRKKEEVSSLYHMDEEEKKKGEGEKSERKEKKRAYCAEPLVSASPQ